MGRFKDFLSKAIGGETQALNLSGMSVDTVEYEAMGYDDASIFLTEVYNLSYWHNYEIDETDVPENEEEVLLAYRDDEAKKGYKYSIGSFSPDAAGWKEICFTDESIKEVEIDENFLENKLQTLHDEITNVLDFTPIKSAYVAGFYSASKRLKNKIRKYKWHAVENLDSEINEMDDEVLAAVLVEGSVTFEIADNRVFSMQKIDDKYIAWANIEEFENIIDEV